ncbi:beta strand repeat-containing protein [Massilia sp. TWP1-3-3]|uniref:beta strand repeat-containing protein n=1 Tax=Massilia sp. TWP1-3-3 TaxID=2804573 RepID=UPI003CF1FA64
MRADATVRIGTGSVLEARSKVLLSAATLTQAGIEQAAPASGSTGSSSFGIGAAYVSNQSKAQVIVESGARIKAADLTIDAHNQAKVVAQIKAPHATKPDNNDVSVALSYTKAEIDAIARVDAGATLDVSGKLALGATNAGSYTNNAEVETGTQGLAAAAVAYALHNSHAAATLGANVADASTVSVIAVNDVQKDIVTAKSSVGASGTDAIANQAAAQTIGKAETAMYGFLGLGNIMPSKDLAPASAQESNAFRLGGAIAMSTSRHTADAVIGNGSVVHATGSIAVASRLLAADVKISATSAAVSQSAAKESGGAKSAFSAGLSFGNFTHEANATVGENALLTAPRIGVSANTLVPIRPSSFFDPVATLEPFTRWTTWENLRTTYVNLDLTTDVFNGQSSAKASGDGSEDAKGIYGSLNLLTFNDHARSEVMAGARLNVSGMYNTAVAPWSASIKVDPARPEQKFDFTQAVTVRADYDATYLFMAGRLPGGSSATGLGASIGQTTLNNTTAAVIREGVVIEGIKESASGTPGTRTWSVDERGAADSVAVQATSKERIISLAMAGGGGATFGLNGTLVMSEVNSNALALVDDEATIRSKALTLSSSVEPVLWTAGGGLSHASTASVGVGIAINRVDTSSRAEVADNDSTAVNAPRASTRNVTGAALAVRALAVEARSGGAVNALAIAGSVAKNSSDPKPGIIDKIKEKYNYVLDNTADAVNKLTLTDAPAKPAGAQKSKEEPSFAFAGAGSASANAAKMRTSALVANVNLDQASTTPAPGPASLVVRAVSDADVLAASGSAALALGGATSNTSSSAIAGAVAVNQVGNGTSALLKNTHVTGAGDVKIQALTGGEQLAIALAMAVNSSSKETTTSNQLVGSISITTSLYDDADKSMNFAHAGVADASIEADDSAPANAEVTAYNRSFIGTGGGSLAVKISRNAEEKGVAAGLAVSFANVSADVSSTIDHATVKNFKQLDVKAFNATEIASGAAFIAASNAPDGNSISGSTVISMVDSTTRATIGGDSDVGVTGNVTVLATDAGANEAYELLINPDGKRKNAVKGLDYCGGQTSAVVTPAGSCITAVAGNVMLTGGNNMGASAGYSQIKSELRASIDNASVTASGPGAGIDVAASSTARLTTIAAGVGVSKKAAGTGSFSVNYIDQNVTASVGNAGAGASNTANTTLVADNVHVGASDKSVIATMAGAIALGKENAVGGALTLNDSSGDVLAKVDHATIHAAKALAVNADSGADIKSLAVSGVGSSGDAVGAALALNFIANQTDATVGHSALDSGTAGGASSGNAVTISAADKSAILSGSGAAVLGMKSGVGGAFSFNSIDNGARATLDASSVTQANTLSVTGALDSNIRSAAISVGVGVKDLGVSGSVTLNWIGTGSGNVAGAAITASDLTLTGASATTTIKATDESRIESLAGAVAGGKDAGIGAAVADNKIATAVTARVDDSAVHGARAVTVAGESTAAITSGSVAGALGGNGGLGGSASSNRIDNQTFATLSNAQVDGGNATVRVTAHDAASIDSLAGTAAAGGTAAVGAALAVNLIGVTPGHAHTAQASVTGKKSSSAGLAVKDLLVSADSASTINTKAAAGAAAGTGALAGSVVTNIVAKNAKAFISDGAKVSAANNIGVLAFNNDQASVFAGAIAVGGNGSLGVSAVFNQMDGVTSAAVTGAATEVDARGADAGKTVEVNSGELASAPDVGSIGAPRTSAFNLDETKLQVRGLAVNAAAHQSVNNIAATLSVSGGGSVAMVPVINLMGGETAAFITDAKVNTGSPVALAGADVNVLASSHGYAGNFAAGGSGGVGAATGAATANKTSRSTQAYVKDATIGVAAVRDVAGAPVGTPIYPTNPGATDGDTVFPILTTTTHTLTLAPSVGAVTVQARASQSAVDIVGGFAVGGAGLAATGAVTIFGSTTDAFLEGGQVVAGKLAVDAKSRSAYNSLALTGAGGGVGVGAAFGVGISDSTTRAWVGVKNATTRSTALMLGGDLAVAALTDNTFNSAVLSGSAAGLAAVAGSVDVTLVKNRTEAGVYHVAMSEQAPATVVQPVTSAMLAEPAPGTGFTRTITTDRTGSGRLAAGPGAVSVTATETMTIKPNIGAASVSATLGAGASANVVIVKSAVTSEIIDSAIVSSGTVKVDASSTKTIDMAARTVAGGGSVGIGGSLGLIVLGSGNTGGANSELDKDGNGTLSQVSTFASTPSSQERGGDPAQRSGPGYDVKASVNDTKADAVTARIVGGVVNANAVVVKANALTSTKIVSGAATVGGLLGAGGAVGVARVYSTVDASLTQASVTAAKIDVTAFTGDGAAGGAARVTTVAGAAGLVGLGAAVSDAKIENSVSAKADGNFTGNGSNAMTVLASDDSTVAADGLGAAVGAAAVGVVISTADKGSDVRSEVGDNTSVAGYSQLAVTAAAQKRANNDKTVQATAVGAAGGLLLAGSGAQANATNTTGVRALVGNNVKLPDGNITIAATNTSSQHAKAEGYAGAGLFAASGAVAHASSGQQDGAKMTTVASIGDNASTGSTRKGFLSVMATGEDLTTSTAIAAAGGVVAGNASVATTADYADTSATLGAGGKLHTSSLTLAANHIESHLAQANSLNASAFGGSGANTTNNAGSTVAARIGAGTSIAATNAVLVRADNMFYTAAGNNESASGAGGGVANGAAAGSSSTIVADTKVALADDVSISSGPGTDANPYSLEIVASNQVSMSDKVVLKTGGLLAGAGVSSVIVATLDNDVTIGRGNQLSSLGSLGIGSYTSAAASAVALVETHGLAVVGSANALTDLGSTQNVTIKGSSGTRNTLISSFGNIDITAGNDPTGAFNTLLTGNASGQAYVNGLIAVPKASATTNLRSDASLAIDAGATVQSAQNATIGAYQGRPIATANGTGRGFALGFIPVTAGKSTVSTPSSARVVMDGTVNAGIYHDLTIVIPDCKDAGIFCSQINISADSAPTTATFERWFDSSAYIKDNFKATAARDTMLAGVSATPVGAVKLGALYAAGGTVTVNASDLSGSGKLVSHGAPKIEVINYSPNYLVVGSATIPNTPGGQILFSGTAGRASASNMTLTETGKDGAPVIILDNRFGATVQSDLYGPAMMLMGAVNNLGGAVRISNLMGSVGQTGQILGQQVNLTAPRGAYAVDMAGDEPFYAGANPYAEWQKSMIWPGGNPSVAAPRPDLAIAFVASSEKGAWNYNSDDAFNRSFVHQAGAALGSNYSDIYYGSGFRNQDSAEVANSLSPIGRSIPISELENSYIPMVKRETLHTEMDYSKADLTGSAASAKIFGGTVSITAKYIDVNGGIIAGQPTDWSLGLGGNLTNFLNESTYRYYAFGTSHLIKIPDELVSGLKAGDKTIGAEFNVLTRQITVKNVSASSGGGSVSLNGNIISTNKLGNIHVNGGFGKVNVSNDTPFALVIQDVNAGSSAVMAGAVGKIDITNTALDASNNHYLYTYDPAVGMKMYRGAAWTKGQDLAYVGSSASASAEFAPVKNMRWEWKQNASLARTIGYVNDGWVVTATNWQFNGDRNNPWSAPEGKLVQGASGAADFIQDITGYSTKQGTSFGYGGCDGYNNHGGCNYGFLQTEQYSNGIWRARWNYNHVNTATLQMTSSVRADNPIRIDFSGNTVGEVNIASAYAPVYLAGAIINPGGATSISTGGALTQGARGTLSTHDLTLNGGAGVGTASKAISASLSTGGTLNASTANGGVYLDLASGARIGQVSAGGNNGVNDVVIQASGTLSALPLASGSANISGSNITLSSELGAVGALNAPMVINARGNPGINGAIGGVVNVGALQDIGLRQIGGDLLVGTIASRGNGDIGIDVTAGTMYDARGQTPASTLSKEQVQDTWKSLKLTAALGAETGTANDASVRALAGAVSQEYKNYWGLRKRGTVDANHMLTLDAANLEALRAAAPAGASDAQVQAMANDMFQASRTRLADSLADNGKYGSQWESAPDFSQRYNLGFAFQASAEQIGALTARAQWDENQLSYSISKAALEPAAQQQVGAASANIVGHAVTINTSAAVGKLAPAVYVSVADLQSGNLLDVQKAALGIAKAPGDVRVRGKDMYGNAAVYDFGTLPGATMDGFEIAQISPLFIDATAAININAKAGTVFLQGTGVNRDLSIDHIVATGDVRLTAPESITAAGSGVQIDTNGNLRLSAASGDLGSALKPLVYRAAGILQVATAGNSAYLTTYTGDMRIGALAARNTVSLNATGGSILADNFNAGLTIQGQDLVLNAAGSLGAPTNPLRLKVSGPAGVAGSVNGHAGDSIFLYSPQAASMLSIAKLDANKRMHVQAEGDLSADELHTGGALVVEARDVTIDNATARTISINANGDLALAGDLIASQTLDLASASLAMGAGSAAAAGSDVTITTLQGDAALATVRGANVRIDAAGGIAAVRGGDNVVATAPFGAVTLNAAAIGDGAARVQVAAPDLSARSRSGDLWLGLNGDTRVSLLEAAGGQIDVLANASIDAQKIGGRAVQVMAAGTLHAGSVYAGNGALRLGAGGAVSVTNLNAAGSAVIDSGLGTYLDQALVGDTLTVNAGAQVAITNGRAGGNVILRGDGVTLGMLGAGADVAIASDGALRADELEAGKQISLDVAGDANLIVAKAGDRFDLQANSATFKQITAKGDARLAATGGNLNGKVLDSRALTASATGEIRLDQVKARGNATLASGGELIVGKLDGLGNTELHAGSHPGLGSLKAAGDLLVNATGVASIGTANAGGKLDLYAGAAAFGTITVGGKASLITMGGSLSGNTLNVLDDTFVQTGTGATLRTVRVGNAGTLSDLDIRSGGKLAMTDAAASRDASLRAGSLALGKIATGRDLLITAGGDADLTTANAGRNVLWRANAATFDAITAGGNAVLTTGGGKLAGNNLSAATLAATAGGDASLVNVAIGGTAEISTGGALDINQLTALGDTSLAAGTTATLQTVTVGNAGALADLAVTSGGALALKRGTASRDAALRGRAMALGSIDTGRDLLIAATGAVTLETATAGANVGLRAGAAAFNTITAGANASLVTTVGNLTGKRLKAGSVTASVSQDGMLERADIGSSTAIAAGGALDIVSLASLGNADLSAGGSATLGTVRVGETGTASSLTVDSGGKLSLDLGNASSDVALRGASLALGSVTAGRDMQLDARASAVAGQLDAGRNLVASVADDAALAQVRTGGTTSVITGDALQIGTLVSNGDASLASGTIATLGNVEVGTSAALSNLVAASGADMSLHTAKVSGDVALRGASLALGSVTAGRDMQLAARANVAATQLDAGRNMLATVAADAALNQVSVGGTTSVTTGGALDIVTLVSIGDTSLASGTSATLGNVEVGDSAALSNLVVASGADMSLHTAKVSGDVALRGASLALGRVTAGGDMQLGARANLKADQLDAAGNLLATVGADAALNQVRSGGATSVATGGALDIATLVSSGDASLASGTSATLGNIEVGDSAALSNLVVASGTDMSVQTAKASGNAALRGTSLVLGSVTAGRDMQLDARANLKADQLDAAGNLLTTVGADAALNQVRSGGATRVATGGALDIVALVSNGDASLTAGTSATVGQVEVGTPAALSNLVVASGADMSVQTAKASGNAALRGTSLVLGSVTAGRDMQLDARTNLKASQLDAAGNLLATVAGDAALAQVRSGGTTSVATGGALDIVTLASGGDARLASGTSATLGNVAVGMAAALSDLAIVSGGKLSLQTAKVSRDMQIDTGGNIAAGQIDVARKLRSNAALDTGMTRVQVGGTADIATGGALAIGTLGAVGDTSLAAGSTAALSAIAVGQNLTAKSGGDMSLDTVKAGLDVSLRSAALTAGSITAGRTLKATALADARLGQVQVGGTTAIVTGGALDIVKLASLGDTRLGAGTTAHLGTVRVGDAGQLSDLAVTSVGNMALNDGTASRDIDIDTSGTFATELLGAGRDLRIRALGNATLTTASAGKDLDLRANGASFGAITAGGNARLAATGGNLTGSLLRADALQATAAIDATLTQVQIGGAADVKTGAALRIGTLDALGATSLDAGTSATLGSVKTGDAGHLASLGVTAGTLLTAGTLDASGDVQLHASSMALGAVAAGADLGLHTVTGEAAYNRLAAGQDVTAKIASQLKGGSGSVLTAARDVRVGAGSFSFDEVNAGRDVVIDPVGDLLGNRIGAGASMFIRSSGTINAARLQAYDAIDFEAEKGIKVGSLQAASITASTAGNLTMNAAVNWGKMRLGAGSMDVNIVSQGGPNLELDVTGYRGGVADYVRLNIDAQSGTTFPRLRARNASITSNAERNTIVAGYVNGTMRYVTPSGEFYMNNVNPTSVAGAVVQMYQPAFGFALEQNGVYYQTDAYVTQYAPQYRVIAPNHHESRSYSGIMAFGASAARDIGRMQETLRRTPGTAHEPAASCPAPEAKDTIDIESVNAGVNWGIELTSLINTAN